MHPTSRAIIELPAEGIKLDIPAPVQQQTFQVVLKNTDSGDLPSQGGARFLRAFQIELFDAMAEPLRDVRLWFRAGLSVTLTAAEVEELGGLASVLGHISAGRLQLQKLSRAGGSWTNLHTRFDIATLTFSARVSQFSTFALTLTGQQPTATPTVMVTPVAGPTPRPAQAAMSTPTGTPPPPLAAPPATGDSPSLSGWGLLALATVGAILAVGGALLWAPIRRHGE